jgi:transaldolase
MTAAATRSPLKLLSELGQSVWLDYIDRATIRSGKLKRLIDEDGLSGVTSNPAIFEKAIAGRADYCDDIARLVAEGKSADDIYRELTVRDIIEAADVLRPAYTRADGGDGFVSLEVSPHLARDAEGSVRQARALWGEVNRPNVFIKIPGTAEGMAAIRQCVSEGINVNVTLLFGLERYRQAASAYIEGLRARAEAGREISRVASVASFFLSRIDVMLDPILEKLADEEAKSALARSLIGESAIACARSAYWIHKEIFAPGQFGDILARGARPQRLLWASTSTKNSAYSDVKYVEPLIWPDTINTLPPETLDAYRDHGKPAPRLEEGREEARGVLARLFELGVRMEDVASRLEEEGIEKFIKPYDAVMAGLRKKGAR